MIESKARASRVRYHKKKLVLIYSAMRHHADYLRSEGWNVDYHELPETPDFKAGLARHLTKFGPEKILLDEPNDWQMTKMISDLKIEIPIELVATRRGRENLIGKRKRSVRRRGSFWRIFSPKFRPVEAGTNPDGISALFVCNFAAVGYLNGLLFRRGATYENHSED